MSQTPSHILENLQTALPAVANAVKGGWDNIQNLAIKTNSSVSLPIWSCTLNMTESKSNSLQTEDAEEEEDVEKEEEEEEEEEEKALKVQASRKGRKRVTDSDEEIGGAEKPRKRSKATDGIVRGVSISKKVEKKEEEKEEEEEEEEEKAAKEQVFRKGRIRVTNFDEEMEGVEKMRKRSKAADGLVRGLSISKKEMKQKRTGEKKKKIVLTSKGSKSLKNAVLGKKVGTSRIHP
jgi:ribosome biogenesis protein UTP30